MTTATIKNVNASLAASGIPLELVRGKGYHYFIYDCDGAYDTYSVMVYRTSQVTIKGWLEYAQEALTSINEALGEDWVGWTISRASRSI